jgi:hypothetical protein
MFFRNVSLPVLTAAITSFIISGCASTQPTQRYAYLVAWNEWPYEYALSQLGHPVYVVEDQRGGRALAYSRVSQLPTRDVVIPRDSLQIYEDLVWHHPRTDVSVSRLARDFDILYVDEAGYVYSFQSNESDYNVRTHYEETTVAIAVVTGVLVFLLLLAGG